MFNPISATLTGNALSDLLQEGRKEEPEAIEAFIKLLKKNKYTSVNERTRVLLSFCLGYFTREDGDSDPVIRDMSIIYSVICANIANGHITI